MSSLLQIKLKNQSRATNEKKQDTRHKAALLLAHQYLISHGYIESAKQLEMELGQMVHKLSCADNIDLERILVEYEEYYKMKFGKGPVLLRKNAGGAILADHAVASGIPKRSESSLSTHSASGVVDQSSTTTKQPSHRMKKIMKQMESRGKKKDSVPVQSKKAASEESSATRSEAKNTLITTTASSSAQPAYGSDIRSAGLDLIGKRMNSLAIHQPKKKRDSEDAGSSLDPSSTDDEADEYFDNRLLKPLPPDLMFGEYRDLAESIRRDIIVNNPSIFWDDIAGLEEAKQLVTEAVIMPIKFPQFFKGLLQPWRGILLFGPPGTGKTMLAKAVATECKTTFFNISASSIVSKWRGESEKLVRCLFELARHYAPSTIFLDELDSIMSQRQGSTEHEGSRRMKTELLIQMDGLAKTNERVFVLAASNLPWDLDQAILRRLEKRIYVGLPEEKARKAIFESLLPEDRADRLDYDFLAKRTESYSGADITLVCKEAAMRPIRRVMKQLESVLRSSQSDHDALAQQKPPQPDKVVMRDLGLALKVTKPSGNMFHEKYDKWQSAFGSTIHLDDGDD